MTLLADLHWASTQAAVVEADGPETVAAVALA